MRVWWWRTILEIARKKCISNMSQDMYNLFPFTSASNSRTLSLQGLRVVEREWKKCSNVSVMAKDLLTRPISIVSIESTFSKDWYKTLPQGEVQHLKLACAQNIGIIKSKRIGVNPVEIGIYLQQYDAIKILKVPFADKKYDAFFKLSARVPKSHPGTTATRSRSACYKPTSRAEQYLATNKSSSSKFHAWTSQACLGLSSTKK